MGIYRQGEKDQGARIGRLERYVYDFHGNPNPGTKPPSGGGGGGTTPPGGGGGGGGSLPPLIPPPVSGDTPIKADGTVPFSGDAFFLKSLYITNPNEGIVFYDKTGGRQSIVGLGTNGVGMWGMGRLEDGRDQVSIVNRTGTEESSILLDSDGVVELSDTIRIKDKRPGGSKDTISIDSSDDVSNVGLEFCNNGVTKWNIFKTGTNNLEFSIYDDAYGSDVSVLTFNEKGDADFTGYVSSDKEPKKDTDLINKKYLETHYTPIGGGSGGSEFKPGKPIVARDYLNVVGNGSTLIGLTGNLEQYVYGENSAGKKWGVGKTGSTDFDVELFNEAGASKTFVKVGDGRIDTSGEIHVGDGQSKAFLEINTSQVEESGLIFSRQSKVMSTIKDIHGDLIFDAYKHVIIKTNSDATVRIDRGHGIEYILTTDSGVTRPTQNVVIGAQFFDVTLGKPIWAKGISPTVWVDAFGKIV